MHDEVQQKQIDRLNLLPSVIAMGWLWGTPILVFWSKVFGLL